MNSKLLLDTHVVLWWLFEPERLTTSALEAIRESDAVFVSVVSAWEAAIKSSVGKLELPKSFSEALGDCGFAELLIQFSHAERCAGLPLHHRDPFDRMLVAQSQAEDLLLVTHDRQLRSYDVEILVA